MAFSNSSRAAINVTPLVDVVLVMLVIFLVATPMQVRSMKLEVPRDNVTGTTDDVMVSLSGRADGSMTLTSPAGSVDFPRIDLAKTLHKVLSTREESVVFVDFDDMVPYGDVVSAMDTVRGAAKQTPGVRVAMTIRPADRS